MRAAPSTRPSRSSSAYCRCVAGSIGRLSLGVFDCSDRERGSVLADDLGVGLQIGNVLRDVREDAANGRVYLPREELARFGCEARDGAFSGPIELVIAFEAERGLEMDPRRARARAAPRPPERLVRARDGRQVPASARADRRRARARPATAASRSGRGRRASCSPGASPGRAHEARIAVVGGGLAGLAAAIACADAGASVTLYEARSRLGGATFSFERNGLELDNGQHVALRCCTAYLGFLRRIGTEQLLPLQPRLHVPVLREGHEPALLSRTGLRPPLHLASTLLRYGPLGVRRTDRGGTSSGRAPEARPRRSGARRADLRRLASRARPVREHDRRALGPDRPPHAEPAGTRRPRSRPRSGSSAPGSSTRPTAATSGSRQSPSAGSTPSPPRRRSRPPAARVHAGTKVIGRHRHSTCRRTPAPTRSTP